MVIGRMGIIIILSQFYQAKYNHIFVLLLQIHPCLQEDDNSKPFRTYETNIALDSKTLKRIDITQNFDEEIRPNMLDSVVQVVHNSRYKVKK